MFISKIFRILIIILISISLSLFIFRDKLKYNQSCKFCNHWKIIPKFIVNKHFCPYFCNTDYRLWKKFFKGLLIDSYTCKNFNPNWIKIVLTYFYRIID